MLAGGRTGAGPLASIELFDAATGAVAMLPSSMATPRIRATATLLPGANGQPDRVLIVGGAVETTADAEPTALAEIYDTASRTLTATGSLSAPRAAHAAIRLADGRVLIVGGYGPGRETLGTAELYSPETGSFESLATVGHAAILPTVVALPSGDIGIFGGFNSFSSGAPGGALPSTTIFGVRTGELRPARNALGVSRGGSIGTMLADGRVLIAGGSSVSRTSELFDPGSESFRLVEGFMVSSRITGAGAVLPTGHVLLSGGLPSEDAITGGVSSAEIYDPRTERFVAVPSSSGALARYEHLLALLPDGRVGVFGGNRVDGTVDFIDVGIPGFDPPPMPSQVAGVVTPGVPFPFAGSDLTTSFEASGGPYPSPSNAPIAVWVPVHGAPSMGTFAPWSATDAGYEPPSTPYAGPGKLFVVRHGRPSPASLPVEILPAENGTPCDADAACASGFCSDGVCCNERCHVSGDPTAVCIACSRSQGAAEDGVCGPVPEDTDPFEDCATTAQCAERFATCGGNGECKACLCTSKLDCAAGYTCTSRGTCERPADVETGGGCSTSAGVGDRGWLALVLLVVRPRRRRSSAAR